MDPWPDRWIIDDWADSQLIEFMRAHGNSGTLELIGGYAEWLGPFVNFHMDRDATARGPITLICLTPTDEARFEDDFDMSGHESIFEVMTPPTRTADAPGFLINATEGLYRIRAAHPHSHVCPHAFCG